MVIHGTLTAYHVNACRCDDCRRAATRNMKRWRLDRERGIPRTVDAAEAQAHVRALLAAGMTPKAIVRAAGWKSRNSLDEVMRRKRLLPRTAARLLAVTVDDDRRPMSYVSAGPTTQRLRDLALLGWPLRGLAAELGMDPGALHDIANGRKPKIRRATALAILGAWRAKGGTPGPSARTAAWARARFAEPEPTPGDGCPTCEDVADLLDAGESWAHIPGRLGRSPMALERHLYRHHRADLVRREAS